MNMVEFFDDASDLEGYQIPQSTASNPGIAASDGQGVFFETSMFSKVLIPTLLNMRPLLTFLVRAEGREIECNDFNNWGRIFR
ncbi:MAG: hypothetical protein KJ687_03040 [Proteobacteria bacterium]|nr:hypothetical protein [Pseudomonadota bacterium]